MALLQGFIALVDSCILLTDFLACRACNTVGLSLRLYILVSKLYHCFVDEAIALHKRYFVSKMFHGIVSQ